jgi:hypothetical protein
MISAYSNSCQLVPLQPIIISIPFHHYKELKECISEVKQIAAADTITIHYSNEKNRGSFVRVSRTDAYCFFGQVTLSLIVTITLPCTLNYSSNSFLGTTPSCIHLCTCGDEHYYSDVLRSRVQIIPPSPLLLSIY